MLALDAKRGVEATLERVFKNTGGRFNTLKITWTGRTAGVVHKGGDVSVMFPGIDETKEVDKGLFNQLIGYALHELGHVWFTTNKSWDEARDQHGAYVSALINGLEDPRIEQRVIDSGHAPNSRALFEHLLNQVLIKDGYVEPDDFKNIPFLLAVEGRRLNGYSICFPSIVNKSPYAKHLRWALKAAQSAKDTPRIVRIAIELYKRLNEQRDQEKQQQQEQGQPEESSEPPNSDGEGQGQGGDDQGDSGDSDASDGDSDAGDADGDAGDSGNPGDADNPDDAGGKSDGKPDGKPSDSPQSGAGWSDEVGRDVEPNGHIANELQSIKSTADENRARPHAGKPIYTNIYFD
jgi:hypothetical protein